MEYVLTFIGWQVFFGLTHCRQQKPDPRLKLPTEDEIKAMVKECYRRFREAIKKQRGQS
ncbi:hypothetical protein ES703_28678 [subsurface metagenome]